MTTNYNLLIPTFEEEEISLEEIIEEELPIIKERIIETLQERFEYVDGWDAQEEYTRIIENDYSDVEFDEEIPENLCDEIIKEVNEYIEDQESMADENDWLLREYYSMVM